MATRPCTKEHLQEAYDLISVYGTAHAASLKSGIPQGTLAHRYRIAVAEGYQSSVHESIIAAVQLGKQKQRLQDVQRIERKGFREHARIENAVSDYAEQIAKLLKRHRFADVPEKGTNIPKIGKAGGIIHISDNHLNERVSLPNNTFDWTVAGKRLKKHAERCKGLCRAYGVTSVLVAMTGDLLNSDRRLDELVSNAGNRAKASVLAVDMYRQLILDLAQDLDVTVAAISGNESRIPHDVGWAPEVASDNYDFTIYEMLRLMLDNKVNFVTPSDPSQLVVNVGGQNVLMIHGHGAIGKDAQKSVQAIKGMWQAKGVGIDMVIWGHIHEALIADQYARSSSLVGSNSYAENALGLVGRASQNFYVLHETGGFDGIKIDLQNTDGVEGYKSRKSLEVYNTKSADKCHHAETIFRVVI
jgi:predicted phosphodiesterase